MNTYKVLLIDANSNWLTQRNDLSDLEQIVPPIGLMYVGTYIQKSIENISVKIINMVADIDSSEMFTTELQKYQPQFIGIRGLSVYSEVFHDTAIRIKELFPEAIIVGGGPYIEAEFQKATDNQNIDYFVFGEGEITFAELIKCIMNNDSPDNINGIAYRKSGKLVKNKKRALIKNLDDLPYPDYTLIDIEKYSTYVSYGYSRRKQGVLFTSRGCPYDCIYCHQIFGKQYRMRSAENVFKEMEGLYQQHNIQDFYILDDNFNLDYKRAERLMDLIIESGLKFRIYFTNGLRGDLL